MPVQHKVDLEIGILHVERWGHINTHDEERACRERSIDPLVTPGIPVLVDCTKVEPTDSVETVRYIADCVTKNASTLKCGPVAIIVSSDVEYGMARMYMAYTELAQPITEVFRDQESALAWLIEERRKTISAS